MEHVCCSKRLRLHKREDAREHLLRTRFDVLKDDPPALLHGLGQHARLPVELARILTWVSYLIERQI